MRGGTKDEVAVKTREQGTMTRVREQKVNIESDENGHRKDLARFPGRLDEFNLKLTSKKVNLGAKKTIFFRAQHTRERYKTT